MMETEERRRCGCFSLLFGVLLLLLSLVMIVVGSLHAAPLPAERNIAGVVVQNCTVLEYCGCPGEPMLPWFLIFGGCIIILLLTGWMIISLVCHRCNKKSRDKKCSLACVACRFSCLTFYFLCSLLVSSLWLVAGTKWLLELHQRKNHATHNPNQDTCDWFLYWFTLILVVSGWISIILALVFRFCQCIWNIICCNICKEK